MVKMYLKGKMQQTKKAFTLIELMVVVAVIAILATLSVTSFSAAIIRTRNAGRQADIDAVATALETCYDVPSGEYYGFKTDEDDFTNVDYEASDFLGLTENLKDLGCLNDLIEPEVNGYDYVFSTSDEMGDGPQRFLLCAKLEYVANWSSVGNTESLPVWTTSANGKGFTVEWTGKTEGDDEDIICDDEAAACYFCVNNQQ